MEEKSSKILQSYHVSPILAESLKKTKSEENKKIEIHIYVKISARTKLRRNIIGDCLNCRGMLCIVTNTIIQ